MKNNELFRLLILSSILFASSCLGNTYSSHDWYLVGYGSFAQGENYSISTGIKLNKQDDGSFALKDVDFKIGDSFKLVSSSLEFDLTNKLSNDSQSLSTNNIYLDNGNIDILKTGKYSITFEPNKENLIISNGTGTGPNEKATPAKTTIDFFAHGDQHGVTDEDNHGVAKWIQFVKEEMNATVNEDVLISNGDLWQGTYSSNVNYGKMLTEVMSNAGYSSFTLGNHEFDWGEKNIISNKEISTVPFLGANVVNEESEKIVNYAQPYTIVEKGDLKIGIVGTIGKAQQTSITSTCIENVKFNDEINTSIKYAEKLRKEFGCHMVIGSFHAGSSQIVNYLDKLSGEDDYSKRYFDGVFAAHDHQRDVEDNGYIPLANSGNNTTYLAHFALTYENGKVTFSNNEAIPSRAESCSADPIAKEIVDRYCTPEIKNKGKEKVGVVDQTFSMTKEGPNLIAKSVFGKAKEINNEVCISIVNSARANIYAGEVTYADVLDAIPFFNKTIIMKVKGADLTYNAKSNYYFSDDPYQTFDANEEYVIAVFDYLAFHQSTSKKYDYFARSAPFEILNEIDTYPCDLVTEHMKQSSDVIKLADYQTINFSFIK